MDRRVVITGVGVVSPLGIGKDTYWEALSAGKGGYKAITLFDTSPFRVHIAGEIPNFDPVVFLGKKGLRTLDRSTRLISSAAKLAIDDAHLEITDDNTNLMGVAIGATFGSLHSISQFDREGLIEGPKYVNPSHFPNTVINAPASQVSIRFKIKGFNATISTGFCAGLDAVSYASDFIRLGRADIVLAGGVEELCEEIFLGFSKMGCLSGSDGSETVSCPFDRRRNGFILSEGAAVVVLEDEKNALKRGATILAVLQGTGNSFDPSADAYFRHAGNGLRAALTLALRDACLTPEDIDYLSACANSSMGLDRMETKVIKDVFGSHAYTMSISSIKSMVGESFSASGVLSLAAAVGSIQKDFIPPTIHYKEKDPDCDLDYVPNETRKEEIEEVMVTSSDPYGHNTAVVLGRYRGGL